MHVQCMYGSSRLKGPVRQAALLVQTVLTAVHWWLWGSLDLWTRHRHDLDVIWSININLEKNLFMPLEGENIFKAGVSDVQYSLANPQRILFSL